MRFSSAIAAIENFFINKAAPATAAASKKAVQGIARAVADAQAERNAAVMAGLLTRDPREIALIEERAIQIAQRNAKLAALRAEIAATKRG